MRPTDKTNVMRVLDSRGIAYGVHTYEPGICARRMFSRRDEEGVPDLHP